MRTWSTKQRVLPLRVSAGSLIPESQRHTSSCASEPRGTDARYRVASRGRAPRATAEGKSRGGLSKCVSCFSTSRQGERGRPAAPGLTQGADPRASAAQDPVPPVKCRVGAVGQRLHRRGHQLPLSFLLIFFAEAHPERGDLEQNLVPLRLLPGRWVVHLF